MIKNFLKTNFITLLIYINVDIIRNGLLLQLCQQYKIKCLKKLKNYFLLRNETIKHMIYLKKDIFNL